ARRRHQGLLYGDAARVQGAELLHAVVSADLLATTAGSQHLFDLELEVALTAIDIRHVDFRSDLDGAGDGCLLHRLDQPLDVNRLDRGDGCRRRSTKGERRAEAECQTHAKRECTRQRHGDAGATTWSVAQEAFEVGGEGSGRRRTPV